VRLDALPEALTDALQQRWRHADADPSKLTPVISPSSRLALHPHPHCPTPVGRRSRARRRATRRSTGARLPATSPARTMRCISVSWPSSPASARPEAALAAHRPAPMLPLCVLPCAIVSPGASQLPEPHLTPCCAGTSARGSWPRNTSRRSSTGRTAAASSPPCRTWRAALPLAPRSRAGSSSTPRTCCSCSNGAEWARQAR
jgi:hypothetical protein